MFKIKDRILLGVVSSLLAGVPPKIINNFEHKSGLVDVKYQDMAASLILPQNKTKDRKSVV